MKLKNGQCGLCYYFGNNHPKHENLSEIRRKKEAANDCLEACDLPQFSNLNLLVNVNSGCDAFQAIKIK